MPSTYSRLIGSNVFIRTVTMFFVGRLTEVNDDALVIKEASWIGDTGYLKKFLDSGIPSESDPYPADKEVIINRECLIDIVEFDHPLPTRVHGSNRN